MEEGSKGGVFRSGRRFAPCLRGGGRGKFSAGRRCTEAGCRFTSQEATRSWCQAGQERCGHTRRFPTPDSRHLDVGWASGNQWAGRRRVTPDVRGFGCYRVTPELVCFPANLDHLRVEWMKQGTYKTAWVTPGHDCLCPYQFGHGAAVRPQTNNAIWDGVIGLWGRVALLLSPWCARGNVPTGVNLNQYAGPGSLIRWHSDNEPLFGPQNWFSWAHCQLEFGKFCGVQGASSRAG